MYKAQIADLLIKYFGFTYILYTFKYAQSENFIFQFKQVIVFKEFLMIFYKYMWYHIQEVICMRFNPFRIFDYIFRWNRLPDFSFNMSIPFLMIFTYLAVTVLSVLGGVHMYKKTNNKIWVFLCGIPSILFIVIFALSRIIFFK
jgi:hypothetical protein